MHGRNSYDCRFMNRMGRDPSVEEARALSSPLKPTTVRSNANENRKSDEVLRKQKNRKLKTESAIHDLRHFNPIHTNQTDHCLEDLGAGIDYQNTSWWQAIYPKVADQVDIVHFHFEHCSVDRHTMFRWSRIASCSLMVALLGMAFPALGGALKFTVRPSGGVLTWGRAG